MVFGYSTSLEQVLTWPCRHPDLARDCFSGFWYNKNMINKEESKIWLDENNIINVKIDKNIKTEEIMNLFDKGEEFGRELSGNTSILIDLTSGFFVTSSKFRKEIAERFKDLIRDPGFKKVAVFGGIVAITVASFIISLSKMENVKTFTKREDALRWLTKY